jgi:hypothetical protein
MAKKEGGIDTAKENREWYTQQGYKWAKQLLCALGMVGYPSPKDFGNMVCSNMIRNCPITPSDVKAANNIFGPNIASLKGKIVHNTP